MADVRNEYDVRTDAKRRVTLRSARFSYYHAREFEDGRILLEPRELKAPDTISTLTLSHMDEAMRNMAVGTVGEEFDLAEVQDLIDEEGAAVYVVRKGVPAILELWKRLLKGHKAGILSSTDRDLLKKWSKAIAHLRENPQHPGLNSHEILPLTKRYGAKVFQSYLENDTPAAGRMFWVFGPETGQITIIGLEPHPEDRKRREYDRVQLSQLPPPDPPAPAPVRRPK